jgi:putative heme transporter
VSDERRGAEERVPTGTRDGSTRSAVPDWLDRAAGWSWRLVTIGVLIVLVGWLFSRLFIVTLPVIIGLVLATLCVPLAERLERAGLPRAPSALIVIVGGIAVLGGLIALVAPAFVDQIVDLRPTLEDGVEEALLWLEEGPLGIDAANLDQILSQIQSQASGSGGRIFSGVAAGVVSLIEFLAGIALLIVLLFFFVKDREEITGWLIARTPEPRRDTMRAVGQRAWGALAGYVRGTALVALIDAIGIGIGLAIIGVPLVLPLAFLVFLGAFLPVVGAFIAGLIAVLVALAAGGVTEGLLVLGVIVLVQQIEGNVLQPVIMRRAVALHPTVVLVALTAGAAVGGIVGAFLAVPFAAVVSAVGNELRLRHEARVATAQA